MSIQELINLAPKHQDIILMALASPLVVVLLLALFLSHPRALISPWKYIYSLLVYLTSVPGILSFVLVCYALFFTQQNLLNVNALVYFSPIGFMIVTLALINRKVAFKRIPGFNRLLGLMIMIGVSLIITLAIQKTRIWLVFGGSIFSLFLLAIGIFLLLKLGGRLLFKPRKRSL